MNPKRIILACRNLQKAEEARKKIASDPNVSTSTDLSVWHLDMDSVASMRSFCQRVNEELPALDHFLLNAGIELTEFQKSEGLERTLLINVVGTSYLAKALLPKLRTTAKEKKMDTNLSIVGSTIHIFGPDSQLEVSEGESILGSLSEPEKADMGARYPLSKLMIHMCFNEMAALEIPARNADQSQVIFNMPQPGWCSTELSRSRSTSLGEKFAFYIFGRTPEQGSRTSVHAITAGRETHGCYLSECQVTEQSAFVRSERGKVLSKKVWAETEARIATF
jgi:NAD(P)-dependent dehydrogenase (short-subunit alcohol dehydrogenase family)